MNTLKWTKRTLAWAVIVFSMGIQQCRAQLDPDKLGASILENVTHYCPAITAQALRPYKNYIAINAIPGAVSSATLEHNLANAFQTDPKLSWMNWGANQPGLTVAATEIGNQLFPPPGVPVTVPSAQTVSNVWGELLFWTGAKLLEPYTIDPNTKTLQSSGSTSDAFIEVNFNERFVMRSGKYSDLPWASKYAAPDDGEGLQLLWPWQKIPDIEGTFGYVFGNTSTTSNYTASTIVGSSDIYGETSIGLPIVRFSADHELWKQQLTLELGGGFATDRSFDQVHPTLFAGLGYQGKFPAPLSSTNLPAYWFGRVGMGMIDRPSLGATNVNFESTGGLSTPQFNQRWYPTMGTTVIVPLSSTMSLQMGGNVYFAKAPGEWNITLGVSMDLIKLAKNLGTTLGISQ
jgi:hypothetical protein